MTTKAAKIAAAQPAIKAVRKVAASAAKAPAKTVKSAAPVPKAPVKITASKPTKAVKSGATKSGATKPGVAKPPIKKTSATRQVPQEEAKQYVLDTNVLLHDPTAIFRFQEHDVYLPMVVLEELDRHKKGTADIARNARQVTRGLDRLLQDGSMAEGFPLTKPSNGQATGKLYFRSAADFPVSRALPDLDQEKADNQILACAVGLLEAGGDAVLVTKDINLRVKALACDMPAQDYRNDQVFSDSDILPPGFMSIDSDFWLDNAPACGASKAFWRSGPRQYARAGLKLPVNSFLVERGRKSSTRLWRVESNTSSESVLYELHSLGEEVKTMVEAHNDEQILALNLLRDPNIDCAALLGLAGSGKTLLAIAAGLEQCVNGAYKEVLVTRATVPMGEEIGFLPGSEEEKMGAWLGGTMQDVYEVLGITDPKNPLRDRVKISSMSFMRGRSFQKKYIVIDEAQNLTSRQIRSLLTRAGDGSKVVLTGNLAQIDTPYLDEGSSGLAWAVKKLQNWEHAGHLILPRGERSRLATYVEDVAEQGDD